MRTDATRIAIALLVSSTIAACAGTGSTPTPGDAATFQQDFGEQNADFENTGSNPYFELEPGSVLEFEGTEDRRVHHLTITVLDDTEPVDGVTTRVVEERETVSGELEEVSRNYFAISKKTNSVYYFGEDVDMYRLGKVASHEGSWRSGKDGAHYGLFMPGTPTVGMRYYQEFAPGMAMDRAEIVGLGLTLETPAGTFHDVLRWEETTPVEPGTKESKWFAKGVGLVRDGASSLVKSGKRDRK